jgi:hypothetical protein
MRTVEQAEYWHASAGSALETGIVVLAAERRETPEFDSKIALLGKYGPVIVTNAPCASCGLRHPVLYHGAFPDLRGTGDTLRDAAEALICRLTNEMDIHAEAWPRESVEQAIAEVRMWLGTHRTAGGSTGCVRSKTARCTNRRESNSMSSTWSGAARSGTIAMASLTTASRAWG